MPGVPVSICRKTLIFDGAISPLIAPVVGLFKPDRREVVLYFRLTAVFFMLPAALQHSPPGSRTPVRSPGVSFAKHPDSVAIFPLNTGIVNSVSFEPLSITQCMDGIIFYPIHYFYFNENFFIVQRLKFDGLRCIVLISDLYTF